MALGSASVALVLGPAPAAWGQDSTVPAESLLPCKVIPPGLGIRTLYSFPRAAITKHHKLGCLKKGDMNHLTTLQRPEAGDQALARPCSLCRCWDSVLSACSSPCRLRCSVVAALSRESSASHRLPPVYVCPNFPSYRDTRRVGLGPTLMISSSLGCICKDSSPNKVTV